MSKKDKSWWRLRQIRHRDAVLLAILAASFLLGGQLTDNVTACTSPPCSLTGIYQDFIVPYLNNPPVLVVLIALALLGFTTYFGGIFVLLGGLHFSWGRIGRGRFLMGLGLGVSVLGLIGRLSRMILTSGKPFGDPFRALLLVVAGLSGLGILLGIASHALMGEYALMLKKHAKRVLRRWRKSRRPARRSSKS
jgi:heme A synthase